MFRTAGWKPTPHANAIARIFDNSAASSRDSGGFLEGVARAVSASSRGFSQHLRRVSADLSKMRVEQRQPSEKITRDQCSFLRCDSGFRRDEIMQMKTRSPSQISSAFGRFVGKLSKALNRAIERLRTTEMSDFDEFARSQPSLHLTGGCWARTMRRYGRQIGNLPRAQIKLRQSTHMLAACH